MAVYTEIGDDELRAFTAVYDIGEVLSCKGIAEGVENSNFLLTTERANFILTLYEKRVAPADLPFFIALMDHLAHQGVACPTPVRARDGEALRELCGRPAAIVTFLNGMWPRRIDPFHCAALGSALLRPSSARNSPSSKRIGRATSRPETSMPICFPTMCSFATARSPASSIFISPAPIFSPTTSRSASTPGASSW